MKYLVFPVLVFSFIVFAETEYLKNDGTNPPEQFSTKSNEVMKIKSAGTAETIERQEEDSTKTGTGSTDKPILDSNPNDEIYKIGPIGEPTTPDAQKMEPKQGEKVDPSIRPGRKTVPQK